MGTAHRRLGDILLDKGLIDEIQLRSAIGHQKNWGGKIGSALVELGFITEEKVAGVLEEQLKLHCLPESRMEPEPAALSLMTMQDAMKYMALPIKLNGGELTLAMSNPFDLALLDEIGFKLGKKIKGVLGVEMSIKRAINRYYGRGDDRDYRVDLKESPGTDDGRMEVVHYGEKAGITPEARAKKVEPPPELLSRALAYLLIEKGIIRKEDLVEKLKLLKEKGIV